MQNLNFPRLLSNGRGPRSKNSGQIHEKHKSKKIVPGKGLQKVFHVHNKFLPFCGSQDQKTDKINKETFLNI